MMIKKLIIILLLLLSNVFSADLELFIPCGGDEELIIGCSFGDEELGILVGGAPIIPIVPFVYESGDISPSIIDLIVSVILALLSFASIIGLIIVWKFYHRERII